MAKKAISFIFVMILLISAFPLAANAVEPDWKYDIGHTFEVGDYGYFEVKVTVKGGIIIGPSERPLKVTNAGLPSIVKPHDGTIYLRGNFPDIPIYAVEGYRDSNVTMLRLGTSGQDLPQEIHEQAFQNCTSLKTAVINCGLNNIYPKAFEGCSALEKVSFWMNYSNYDSSQLLFILEGAFRNCTNLQGFFDSESGEYTPLIKVSTIGEEAFLNCGKLDGIVCPNVETIGERAFKGCSSLTSFICSDKLTAIADSTFEGCSSLTQFTLSESVTSIGSRAFANTGLTTIYIPSTVTEIADNAFTGSPLSVIYGEYGSYAEIWANAHGIAFNRAFDYTVNSDGTVTITKCNLDKVCSIPSAIDGKTVTRISERAFEGKEFVQNRFLYQTAYIQF